MIEGLISRSLLMALGYAYPAFQCFKTLEKNKVGIPELRFWCQYWVIVAVLTILEKFLDIFISWLPMYRIIKLAFFVYLWHPSTKGSSYAYETLVQPYVSRHEPEIDRCITEIKERAWNFALSYWYNCADSGSKKVLQCFQYMLAQCMTMNMNPQPSKMDEVQQSNEAPTPTPPSTPNGIFKRNASEKRRPPVPPPGVSALARSLTTPKPDSVKVQLHNQAQFIRSEDTLNPADSESKLERSESDHDLLSAKNKLRHVKSK